MWRERSSRECSFFDRIPENGYENIKRHILIIGMTVSPRDGITMNLEQIFIVCLASSLLQKRRFGTLGTFRRCDSNEWMFGCLLANLMDDFCVGGTLVCSIFFNIKL